MAEIPAGITTLTVNTGTRPEAKEREVRALFKELLDLHQQDLGTSLQNKDYFALKATDEVVKERYKKLSAEQLKDLGVFVG